LLCAKTDGEITASKKKQAIFIDKPPVSNQTVSLGLQGDRGGSYRRRSCRRISIGCTERSATVPGAVATGSMARGSLPLPSVPRLNHGD